MERGAEVATPHLEGQRAPRSLPKLRPLAALFFVSGFASLLYPVVWQRLLETHYGVGPIANAVIVSVYMVGLGLGALAGGRLADRTSRHLEHYAAVEAAIGLYGAVSLPFAHTLSARIGGDSYLAGAPLIALVLLVPTFFMGMRLPLVTAHGVGRTDDFLRSLGLLYGIHTAGAAVGALTGAYAIISFHGLRGAMWVAVAFNVLVAAFAFLLGRGTRSHGGTPPRVSRTSANATTGGDTLGDVALLAALVSGFIVIAYAIVTFRVVAVFVKDSPYAFAGVLAVFLTSLAIGSHLSTIAAGRLRFERRSLFFLCQAAVAISILAAFTGFLVLKEHRPLEIFHERSFVTEVHPSGGSSRFGAIYYRLDIFFWSAWFAALPALFMGASFPLVASLAGDSQSKPGARVGRVVLAKVVGTVLGSLVTAFVLLPRIGTEGTLLLLTTLGFASLLFVRRVPWGKRAERRVPVALRVGLVIVLALVAIAAVPARGALYEAIHVSPFVGATVHVREGVDTVSVAYERGDELANFVGGAGYGARPQPVFAAEANEALAYSQPKNVLVIGFGTGTMAEMALDDPRSESVTVVESSRTVIENLRTVEAMARILAHPKMRLIAEDGRRFLNRTSERFDLVATDSPRTTAASSNRLFSREFDELVRAHLAEGGIYLQASDEEAIVPRTFTEAFPYVRAYEFGTKNHISIGSPSPLVLRRPFDLAALEERFPGIADLKLVGDRDAVRARTEGVAIATDDSPFAEYFLGRRAHGSAVP